MALTRSIHKNLFRSAGRKEVAFQRFSSRRAVIVQSRQRGFATESLEHAVQLINKFIFEHEERRQRQRAKRLEGKGWVDAEVQPVMKPITFKASAKTEKLVKEPPGPSSSPRGLSDYLALPLDQYSLLDPGWISRSPAAPDVFVLRIPLFDLVGLELQPQITVRVALDPRNGQVNFYADQFKVGDPRFDADFNLAMRATLRNKPVPTLRPLRSIKRMWARAGRGRGGGGSAGAATAAAAGASPRPSVAAAESLDTRDGSESAAASEDEDEDIVVRIIDGGSDEEVVQLGGSRAPGTWSGERDGGGGSGEGGGAQWTERTAQASYGTYGTYESSGVVDVGLEVNAAAVGGRAAPVVPPHVTVVRDDDSAAGGSGAHPAPPSGHVAAYWNGNSHGSRDGGVGNAISTSSTRGTSAATDATGSCSTIRSSGGDSSTVPSGRASSMSDACAASAAGTTSPVMVNNVGIHDRGAGGGGGGDGEGVHVWPPGSYGPSHPATAAASARQAAFESTSAAAIPVPSHSSATAPPLPAVARSAAVGPAVRQPTDVWTAVAADAAAALSTAGAAAAAAPSDPAPLPFIEESVLYVPAAQWGRTSSGTASSGSSRTAPVAAVAAEVVLPPETSRTGVGVLGDADPEGGSGSGSSGRRVLTAASAQGVTAVAAESRAAAVAAEVRALRGEGRCFDDCSSSNSVTGDPGSSANRSASSAAPGAVAVGPSPPGAKPPATSDRLMMASGGYSSTSSSCTSSTSSTGGTLRTAPAGVAAQALPGADATAETAETAAPPPSYQRDSGSSAVAGAPLAVTGPGGGGGASTGADDGATALLVGSVDVAVTVMLPPALAAVPRPLLGMTGSLIARYAISSLLPSFLDLLVADYGRWSMGQSVAARAAPAGDLAATAAANAVAMGATASGAARSQHAQQQPQ